MRGIGLDRTRRGWVVAILTASGVSFEVVGSASDVDADPGDTVAIDVPLPPLPDGIGRSCEDAARQLLGTRASTVFPTLPRWCYERDYDEAARSEARRRFGKSYSKQAWNLRTAIFDAEQAASAGWLETHPELAFLVRNDGRPLPPKKTWDGVRTRLDVLARVGVDVPTGGFTLSVPPDDVLDAVMCSVVARDVASGEGRHVPVSAGPDEPRIWY